MGGGWLGVDAGTHMGTTIHTNICMYFYVPTYVCTVL